MHYDLTRPSRQISTARYVREIGSTRPLWSVALALWVTVALPCALAASTPASSAPPRSTAQPSSLELPWRQAGLDAHQAAAHVLDRLTFGARPGDVQRVVDMGIEVWVDRQLAGGLPETALEQRLEGFHSLDLGAREAGATYLAPPMLARLAERRGVMERSELDDLRAAMENESGLTPQDRRQALDHRQRLMDWAEGEGFRPLRELYDELITQKFLRATYAENQLTEILVEFWFNHFNVSLTDVESRVFIPSYERDAIRPFVLGSFRGMLETTAKHPAMLHYLDNVRSIADEGQPTTVDVRRAAYDEARGRRGGRRGLARDDRARRRQGRDTGERPAAARRPEGLNENYARELLELHTLGVDGGYDQQDVIEVARAFTGWATYPPGVMTPDIQRRVDRAKRYPEAGFVFDGAFIFRADSHDAAAKTVLGHHLPPGQGVEDGLRVLDILALHPSTARHLGRKLAVRFVGDEPSDALVDHLAAAYLAGEGDLRATLRALVQSAEFWRPDVRGQKIKSPFELAVSALRALDAELEDSRALNEWLGRMGQPLYAYQAPTGYPDRATAWVNTGALLNRMNFGLQLATGRVAGVRLDLLGLRQGREPESMDAALTAYLPLLLPQRDTDAAEQRLQPIIRDPNLLAKIDDAAPDGPGSTLFDDSWDVAGGSERQRRWRRFDRRSQPEPEIDDSPVAQVVGVILGSPDFQRR